MQSPHVVAEGFLGFRDGLGECLRPGVLRHIGEYLGEFVPLFGCQLVSAELVDRVLGDLAEFVVGQIFERRRDDLNVRGEVRLVQMRKPGYQFTFSQIPCRAEQHNDVRFQRGIVVTMRTRLGRRIRDGLRFLGGHSRDTSIVRRDLHVSARGW